MDSFERGKNGFFSGSSLCWVVFIFQIWISVQKKPLIKITKMFALLVSLFLLVVPIIAYNGVDVSSRVTTSSWQCMAKAGYTFACVRVYQVSEIANHAHVFICH